MSDYKKLINIVNDEQEYIDISINNYDKKILSTLKDVNSQIVSLVNDYTAGEKLKVIDLEFAIANKIQLENLLENAEYYNLSEEIVDSLLPIIDNIVSEYKLFDYDLTFTNLNREAIKELINRSAITWEGVGQKTANEIYNAIYNSTVTNRKLNDFLGIVRDSIEDTSLKKYARTYLDTEYMKFNRTITNMMSNETGWSTYQFVGPIDIKVSHDFCLKHVGEIMTRKQIDEYSNQYGFDIFVNGGGYNCRHKWANVPPNYRLSSFEKTAIDQQLKIMKMSKAA